MATLLWSFLIFNNKVVFDTKNQDYGGLDNFDEKEDIILIYDDKIDNEEHGHQEPCAWDWKVTVSIHIFKTYTRAQFCIRVQAISCSYTQESSNKVYTMRQNFWTIKISDA